MSDFKFIKATPGPKNSVTYETEDGKKFCYFKGDRPWRNHNPGNLIEGDVSRRNGAIGKAGGFAVFPDYEAGHRALIDLLKNTPYREQDLEKLIKKYAPPKENNTAKYLRFLRKKTGVKDDKKIKNFSAEEFEKLWKAIEQMEGQRKGEVTECSEKLKITAIQRDEKKTISAYYIQTLGWVSKERGIALTSQGKVDAVIAHSRTGNLYLRTRPDDSIADNLDSMG